MHAHLEDWEKSRDDARTCVSLRGTWAKGWVRLGHALCGLEEWEEAKEAFSRARDLEPDDQKIEKAWQKVPHSLTAHVRDSPMLIRKSAERLPPVLPSAGLGW